MGLFGKFNFSSGFKRIFSNTGYLFGEKVFNMGLSLLVGIWVARCLGPKNNWDGR
jgi:PST family polysaccharide transporter